MSDERPPVAELRGGPLDGRLLEAPPNPHSARVWNTNFRATARIIETHGYRPVTEPDAKHLVMVWVGRLETRNGTDTYVRLVPPPPQSGQ